MLAETPALDDVTADSAVRALGHLGRGLGHLEPVRPDAKGSRRQLATTELAAACLHVAGQWSPGGARLDTLAAVTADAITSHDHLNDEKRWAGAGELAAAIGACVRAATSWPPYASAPSLQRVQRYYNYLDQSQRADPPSAASTAWLDHPVTAGPATTRPVIPSGGHVIDTAARLVSAMDREERDGDPAPARAARRDRRRADLRRTNDDPARRAVRRQALQPAGRGWHGCRRLAGGAGRVDQIRRRPPTPVRSTVGGDARGLGLAPSRRKPPCRRDGRAAVLRHQPAAAAGARGRVQPADLDQARTNTCPRPRPPPPTTATCTPP